jgi:hypothetical protein
MARHLLRGRIRVSTVLVGLMFFATLTTYLLIRPWPASIAQPGPSAPPSPAGKPSKTASPPAPSPTPSAVSPRPSPSPTAIPSPTTLHGRTSTPLASPTG